jgi:hypothetical protein
MNATTWNDTFGATECGNCGSGLKANEKTTCFRCIAAIENARQLKAHKERLAKRAKRAGRSI